MSEELQEAPALPAETAPAAEPPRKSPLQEIIQPFIDLVHAPRALWGINLSYLIEGLVYFGWLTLLAIFFNKGIGLNDVHAGWMVSVLTGGITLSMLFFGGVCDKWGVRKAIIVALTSMLLGRVFMIGAASVLPTGGGLWSPLFWSSLVGVLGVILGYGLYQPAAYAAVRQFTDQRSSAMGYAMLYALMNLGGFLPGIISPLVRGAGERSAAQSLGLNAEAAATSTAVAVAGISSVYWLYVVLTVVGLIAFSLILTKRVQKDAIEAARSYDEAHGKPQAKPEPAAQAATARMSLWERILHWIRNHPLADAKFSFFIFCLIPVQTLFAHNWLTLPQYVDRALGKVGSDYMEFFVNLNPILIFVLTPVVAALTTKSNVYRMMILGTLIMAAPTFLLAIAPSIWLLLAYLVIMSVGEAMWQPRFLQYAAEIAPPGRTGAYMGVAQFPWFLTKIITGLYSGWFLMNYCPEPGKGTQNTTTMWLIYACIAMLSTVMLFLARNWIGKDFKTKSS